MGDRPGTVGVVGNSFAFLLFFATYLDGLAYVGSPDVILVALRPTVFELELEEKFFWVST